MADRKLVLLIEDNPGDVRLIREMLAEGDDAVFELACVGRLSQGLEHLATKSPSLVLLDLSLPDSFGFDTFLKVYAHSPKVPIVVLTGHDDQTVALSAVKSGAQDYLVKGKLDRELLLRSMQYSIERKRYQEQLEYQANYDALTGLPNRNLLHDRLKQSVFAQRYVRSIAVVFLDIDHFKFVNDSLGHNTGDKLLQKVAERLMETVRDGDTVARLGGDEFILILNDQTGQEVIYRAMQRIITRIAEPIDVDGQELMVTCSAGISLYPQDGPDVDTLLKNADAAMYRAKEKGRNNVQFYTAEMNRQVNERLKIESSLRRALERDELELYYQPRINVRSGALVSCEALLRWRHPEWGLLLPERFIALAEETGIIVPIGDWVLKRACAQARAWQQDARAPIAVSVNLSMRQFRQGALATAVDDALRESQLDPRLLEMELTESLIMHDTEAAIRILLRLREIGVDISVDDFGTGHSSLSYLTKLPISALKIDQSFVHDIKGNGRTDEGLVAQTIISLARNLKLKVVGEGVETEAQFEFLKKHDCDEVQGYHFGRPMPAAEFESFAVEAARSGKS
ncbi:MAG TPA: EAL domain-containing protein [Burkholderiales bacterium]|nr:EAL domain-containing protein [Burkholderiales bacterium]